MIDRDLKPANIPVPAGWVVITETHPGTFDQHFFDGYVVAMDFADVENERPDVAFVFIGEIRRVKGRPARVRLRYGNTLRRLRKSRDLSLGWVADVLGLRASRLSDVELGRAAPFDDALTAAITECLNLTEAEIAELRAEAPLWTENS